jgi:fatty-acyl-CoA synthase
MVVTLVAPEPGHALAEDDVIGFLKPKLASYKVPRKVLFVEAGDLALTDTAKIKPAEARKLAQRKMEELEGAAS